MLQNQLNIYLFLCVYPGTHTDTHGHCTIMQFLCVPGHVWIQYRVAGLDNWCFKMQIHSFVFYAQGKTIGKWNLRIQSMLHPNKPSVEKHMTSPNRQHTKEQMNSLKHQLMQSHVCKVQIEEETKCWWTRDGSLSFYMDPRIQHCAFPIKELDVWMSDCPPLLQQESFQDANIHNMTHTACCSMQIHIQRTTSVYMVYTQTTI